MRDWSSKPLSPRCDMCAERKPDVLRFGLVRRFGPNKQGRATTRGAGGIWLCEQCWSQLEPMRVRVRRYPLRRVS